MGRGPSCSAAYGVFLDQDVEPASPALAGGFFIIELPGKSCDYMCVCVCVCEIKYFNHGFPSSSPVLGCDFLQDDSVMTILKSPPTSILGPDTQ